MNQLSNSEPNFFEIDANDLERAGSIEPLGTKRKFWMKVADGSQSISYLVKLARPNTGEDWAEYLASKLAALLGLPHAKYELGTVTSKDGLPEPAVRSKKLYEQGDSLVHGNQLLVQIDPRYPANEARKYRLSAHTVDAVKAAVGKLEPPRPNFCQALPTGVTTAIDVYIGYLLLDAWVANQDRHHENWGAIELNGKLTLSPTYDHGSALGSLILDEERRERLISKDRNRSVEAFAKKARSALFATAEEARTLETRYALLKFSQGNESALHAWQNRLKNVSDAEIMTAFEDVPQGRLSTIARQFTLQLLKINKGLILNAGDSL